MAESRKQILRCCVVGVPGEASGTAVLEARHQFSLGTSWGDWSLTRVFEYVVAHRVEKEERGPSCRGARIIF